MLAMTVGRADRNPSSLRRLTPAAGIIHLYTSGTPGEAKRVRKTLAQFDAEIAVLETTWGTR